jgi:hypothetical protein
MALKKNNMERKSKNGGFKMKGHTLPGISQMKAAGTADGRAKSSAFQKKPTKQELIDAANDPNNPNHISKFKTKEDYYAWRGGSKIAKRKDLYHGEGGKIMNLDGTVNKKATRENVAHLKK